MTVICIPKSLVNPKSLVKILKLRLRIIYSSDYFTLLTHSRLSLSMGLDNDPSVGSPTKTLLQLFLPLNDKIQWTSHDGSLSCRPSPLNWQLTNYSRSNPSLEDKHVSLDLCQF